MWLKVAALLLYLLLLFAVSRLLEMSVVLSWAVNLESAGLAFFSTALVHPVSLSVREIKKILDARGVSYVGLAEKRELTDLVENSGRLMESELDEVMIDTEQDLITGEAGVAADSLSADVSTTRFTCGSHFYEEVEDSKDSIWLVLVVPPSAADVDEQRSAGANYGPSTPPLLDQSQWRQLVARVKPFGIRTGILNCHLDRRLCRKKGWHGHQIVLALPKGIHPKDNVVLHSYKGRSAASAASVFSWVRKRLSSRLAVIETNDQLERLWLNFTDAHVETKVRVLLSTTSTSSSIALEDPPLAYSALSMKFSGRVSFGLVDSKLLEQSSLRSSSVDRRSAVYVIVTPEGTSVYGDRAGEHLTYKSMELYFRTLQPEMNDVFTLSLVVTNILACLDFFAIRRKLWRQLVHCTWTLVKYNVVLFSFWIAVFGLNHLRLMRITSDLFLALARHLARSEQLGSLRHHYRFWRSCPKVLLASFVALWFVYGAVRKRWFQVRDEDEAASNANVQTSWLSSFNFTGYLFRRPRINGVDHATDLEEGLTLWIERLATPNLWLYPLIPYDYIKDLPTWRFRGNCTTSTNVQRRSASESSEDDTIDVNGGEERPSPPSSNSAGFGQRLLEWTIGKNRTLSRQQSAAALLHCGRCCERPPADTKEASECAICLEVYVRGVLLCGLQCGHNYHHKCIVRWLSRDHHNCPICRRPSYGGHRSTNDS